LQGDNARATGHPRPRVREGVRIQNLGWRLEMRGP
jgi:hypothetical protein